MADLCFKQIAVAAGGDKTAGSLYGLTDDGLVYFYNSRTKLWEPAPMRELSPIRNKS
jgi:hypothetical protein